ncbi:MAG: O-antigen ligase family protein [Pseudomonadota bacterium]
MESSAKIKAASLFVILAGGLIAGLIVSVGFTAESRIIKFALLGGILMPLVILMSGNQRLFFLVGLILAAPLGLSLNFLTIIHIGGSPSYSIDLTDFFLVPLLVFILRDLFTGKRSAIRIPSIGWWWAGLIVLGIMSMVIGPLRNLTGYEVLRMVKGLLILFVIVNECVRRRHFVWVLLALAAGLWLQILVGLVQFVIRRDLGLQALGEAAPEAIAGANLGVYLTTGSVFRVSSLMGHPNLLSAYLALLLPIFIALLFTNLTRWVKIGITTMVLFGGIVLVITLSRSGWIAFAAAFIALLMFVFFESNLRKRHLALKGFFVVFAFSIALVASGPVIKRLTESDSGAVDFRYEFMGVAVRMIEARPVLGFGLNKFVYEMAPYTRYGSVQTLIDRFGEHWPAVHNIYLLVWSEQGTIGIILFLAFHIHLFRIGAQNLRYHLDPLMHAVNIGAMCGIVALLVDGMASFFIRVPASNRVFWIVVARFFCGLFTVEEVVPFCAFFCAVPKLLIVLFKLTCTLL